MDGAQPEFARCDVEYVAVGGFVRRGAAESAAETPVPAVMFRRSFGMQTR
jgi:hypothetical protein